MRVVEISGPGGPEVLRPATRPIPVPGTGEVVIRVAVAGVNRPDILQRLGRYAPPKGASDLPGLEVSGHVHAIGPGVVGCSPGEAVCALVPGGGYAEFALTDAGSVLAVPAGLDLTAAACLPECAFTVWSNLLVRAGLQPGERVLIHGGASGIGTTAIQIAHALGARVFVTARGPEKAAACLALGAERAIDYPVEDFVAVMRDVGGADVILDMVGGDYLPRNLAALADDGRLQQIAVQRGAEAAINLAEVMVRRLRIAGSTLRPQSALAKARIARDLRSEVWPLVAAGRVRPVIDSVFALDDAASAHRRMESGDHIGKIALTVG